MSKVESQNISVYGVTIIPNILRIGFSGKAGRYIPVYIFIVNNAGGALVRP